MRGFFVKGGNTKCRDINANFSIVASNSGFTKNALEKCKLNAIGAISLLPSDNLNTGFKIGINMFAVVYFWCKFYVGLKGQGFCNYNSNSTIIDMSICGQSLYDWFLHYLCTELSEHTDPRHIE